MCGIIGIVSQQPVLQGLLKGLEKLEYRGYDSTGVYVAPVADEKGLFKSVGRVAELEKVLAGAGDLAGQAGIAHTRWATHGGVSVENAHPHTDVTGRFHMAHNGVIENFRELKATYLADVPLVSETDTEITVQLVSRFVTQEGLTPLAALRKMIGLLDVNSAYAFLLTDSEQPDTLYVAKNKSPLLIGVSDTTQVVTSDAAAVLDITKTFVDVCDGDIAELRADTVTLFDATGNPVAREPFTVDIDASETDKGVYPYYMLKEVDEQPIVLRKISQHYFDKAGAVRNIAPEIIAQVRAADRIYIVAAGTSYHAGLVGKRYFEQWTQTPTEVHIASEFAYDQPLLSAKPLFIFLSQSGETADAREVLQNITRQGYPTLTMANVMNSTLTREADHALPLLAGPEIAVASTKAYTAQVALQAILAHAVGDSKLDLREELAKLAVDMQMIIDDKDVFDTLAKSDLHHHRSAFYIGRGLDAAVAVEAALKLKEISYVQTEGFAAGELKHGTISLIEDQTPVLALITQPQTAGLVRSNLEETKARGANALVLSTHALAHTDDAYVLPDVTPILAPILAVVPTQLLAYYATLDRGLNVDRPRNLAKSVTVQ